MTRKITLAAILAVIAALTIVTVRIRMRPAPDPQPAAPAAAAPTATPTPVPNSAMRGKVYIAELMEKNKAVVADEDGDFSDWIEIYNGSGEIIDFAGWSLSDKEGERGWVFPSTKLLDGDRLLVFASRKNHTGSVMHTDFALSGEEHVWLYDSAGALVDEVSCGGCEADVSMARDEAGQWGPCLYPTPGYENSAEGYERYQQTLWPNGDLVINEVMTANLAGLTIGYSTTSDWVEIKNVSNHSVRLSDYWLSDSEDNRLRWRLPERTLAAGELLLIACEDDSAVRLGDVPNTGFALDSAHEQLYLSDAAGTLWDQVSLRDIPAGGSYGRMDGQPGWFYFAAPSPGTDNAGGKRRVSAAPVSLTADGVFENVKAVDVALDGAGEIRYTLDGSLPTAASPRYTGPLTVTQTCVLRAVCIEDGALPSRALNLSYILNEGHSLPVASLVTDSPQDFSLMYGDGRKGYELPGALSLYQEGGAFTIPCGISMNGETSLAERKKNMALRFRGAYGQEELNYDIFGGGVTRFTNLLLRAGQDQSRAVIRNELCQELAERAGLQVINQRSLYCVLYINGEYTGLYTVKEKANEQLYADLMGVSRNSVQLYEAPVPYGSDIFQDLFAPAQYGDLSDDAQYALFCQKMDIDCLIDWLIIEGFCGNTDVTMGNLRYVRSAEDDGKWRILFYDLDATFNNLYTMSTNLMSDYAADHIQISSAVLPLMKNDDFRDRFLRRANELLRDTLNNETVLEEIDRLSAEVRPEIARDFAQLGKTAASFDRDIRQLRSMIEDDNWRQSYLDVLCRMFGLKGAERARYFSDIDGK
ncbi:MAG: CotH kinase family protein [Oscillospiraceae bacterium]|nr:CotH kinase family protein [Oscillospiraceae bacterium]